MNKYCEIIAVYLARNCVKVLKCSKMNTDEIMGTRKQCIKKNIKKRYTVIQ